MTSGNINFSALSLGTLAAELGLGSIAFIKLDIEVTEKLGMKGMTELFSAISNKCISFNGFIAELVGNDSFQSKVEIRAALEAQQYRTRTRPDQAQCLVRNHLYVSRESS
jgi:hypothetical protein